MELTLDINPEKCIRCGECVKICPSMILRQEEKKGKVKVRELQNCIVCGHCVAVCPTEAIRHSEFPAEKVHAFRYEDYPAPDQMMLLLKARRSNRAFSDKPVPPEMLMQIVEAAHRAPTASNAQELGYTIVTDPAKLRLITAFTLGVFRSALKKMQNPLLAPLVKWLMPDAFRYIPVFERLLQEDAVGNDLILRKAKAVLFIHAPRESRFGCQDANLAYQNGSLMAECLGISQFYTGFVCSAIEQEKKGGLEKALEIEGKIYAGMALGMPAFRYRNYIDRKEVEVRRW